MAAQLVGWLTARLDSAVAASATLLPPPLNDLTSSEMMLAAAMMVLGKTGCPNSSIYTA
jgi:hypothetical protein